jgi:hypothetical protein
MPASVVHVVDMIPVRDRDMATPLAVDMVMLLVHRVTGLLAFVVVILVLSMKVSVVHEVDMIPVWDRDMAATFAMRMIVLGVLVVGRAGHRFSPPYRSLTDKLLANRILVRPGGRYPTSPSVGRRPPVFDERFHRPAHQLDARSGRTLAVGP